MNLCFVCSVTNCVQKSYKVQKCKINKVDAGKVKEGLWYVAHPYSGNPLLNFESANIISLQLLALGVKIYSPISHTHPIHIAGVLNGYFPYTEYDLYMKLDAEYLKRCDGIILCPGWAQSKGCIAEKDEMKQQKKPIFSLESFKILWDAING